MRNPLLYTLLALAIALPSVAEEDERHQSFISYDDGGTVVRSGDDGREIEAHRNLPLYPGDEVITARRGRTEIRLSDGNIIGVDRTTALRLLSILDSYEGDDKETVIELKHGKVAVHRTDLGRDYVRLDTAHASYVARYEAIYSVETDAQGRDRVTIFGGSIEVRTPSRSTRLRSGDTASVDDDGVYELLGDQRDSADDFERWFLARSERFNQYDNKYVDRRLGYWTDDLDDHGRWVFLTGVGWSWRPYVAVGWRPYHNGYWHHGRRGGLTWVSYDPWGWGTHHYGRWAYDPGFGWVWVPGYGYSPAWVYWMYGSGYVGWAPAGWWDCYRPYYNWAYYPYRFQGITHHGFGFYGRVRVSEFDLRPWTFVDPDVLISNRVDRAALTTDAVKQRLGRSRDGFATISGEEARFTREEVRDPAEAIRRRGLNGAFTGRETGEPPTDLTSFVRREADVSRTIRDRIRRDLPPAVAGGSPSAPASGSGLAPIAGGSVAPIGRGSIAPIAGTEPGAPGAGRADGRRERSGGRISRGGTTPSDPVRATPAPRDNGSEGGSSRDTWRDRIERREAGEPQVAPAPSGTPDAVERTPRDNSWRSRPKSDDPPRASSPSNDRGTSAGSGSRDVPRRVIDGIGGARVVPRDRSTSRQRGTSTGRRSGDSGSRDRGSVRSSGGSSPSSGGSSAGRSSGGSSSRSEGSSRSSAPSSGSSGSGNRDGGGKIERDQ